MSLRNITGRDTEYLYQELEKIEQRWALEKPGAYHDSPEYRRDKVVADILGLKIDVILLAQSFLGYEEIKEHHAQIVQLFGEELERHIVLQRAIADNSRQIIALKKQLKELTKVAPETAGDADTSCAKGERTVVPS